VTSDHRGVEGRPAIELSHEMPAAKRSRRLGGAFPYVLLLPAIIWVVAFTIYPLIAAIRYSFANYVLGQGIVEYVGFANYGDVLHSSDFWHSILITAIYSGIAVPLELVIGFALAWFVNLQPPGYQFFRVLLIAPLFTMDVAIGYLGVTLYSSQGGLIDALGRAVGLNIPWMATGAGGLAAAILLDVWLWTSFIFLMSLAGLAGISDEIFEAALLDTSSQWRMVRDIVLPLIWPVLSIAFLLRLVESFKTFGLPYALTSGGPGTSTQLFTIMAYLTTLQFFDFGHGAAMSFIFLLLVSVIITIFFRQMRRAID
jgi:multiple sugar transport system permease protein